MELQSQTTHRTLTQELQGGQHVSVGSVIDEQTEHSIKLTRFTPKRGLFQNMTSDGKGYFMKLRLFNYSNVRLGGCFVFIFHHFGIKPLI